MTKKKNTLFGKSKYKYLSDIISFKDIKSAEESAKKLRKEFNDAKTMSKKLRIYRATQYSANRALAITKKKNLNQKERQEFKQISKRYEVLANYMQYKYNLKKR